MTNAEKVKAALVRIESGLESINTDEDWLHFLQFQSLFYHYSFNNAMLIYLQSGGQACFLQALFAENCKTKM